MWEQISRHVTFIGFISSRMICRFPALAGTCELWYDHAFTTWTKTTQICCIRSVQLKKWVWHHKLHSVLFVARNMNWHSRTPIMMLSLKEAELRRMLILAFFPPSELEPNKGWCMDEWWQEGLGSYMSLTSMVWSFKKSKNWSGVANTHITQKQVEICDRRMKCQWHFSIC